MKTAESKLSSFFLFLAEEEQSIDILRSKLSLDPNFDAYQIFKYLDEEGKTYLTERNLTEFLKRHSVFLSSEEAKCILRFYDPHSLNKITFENFVNLVVTHNDSVQKKISSESSFYASPLRPNYLPYNLEYALAKLLSRELDFVQRANSRVREIVFSVDFDFVQLFSSLDVYNTQIVDKECVSIFMNRHGQPLYETELEALFVRLDLDKDKKIKYTDLKDVLGVFCDFYCKSKFDESSKVNIAETRNISSTRQSPFKNIDPEVTMKNAPLNKYVSRLIFSEKESGMGRFNREGSLFTSNEMNFSKYNQKTKQPYGSEESMLVNFLEECLQGEKEIDEIKSDLALRKDFLFIELFKAFELEGRGYLTESDVKYTLRELNLNPSLEEVSLLLRRYNSFRSSTLDLRAFAEMVLPQDKSFSDKLQECATYNITIPYRYFDELLPQTRSLISKLFTLVIEQERKLEGIKQFIKNLPFFNVKEIFNNIDRKEKGYFSTQDLVQYCRENKVFISKGDAELIFNRFDKNKDWKVSYIEFVDELKPMSKEYFPYK